MEINWKLALGGGAAAVLGWMWLRRQQSGEGDGGSVYTVGEQETGFTGGSGPYGDGDTGAASGPAVAVAKRETKSGAGVDRGFGGDASPFGPGGGGAGLADLPGGGGSSKPGPTPIDNFSPELWNKPPGARSTPEAAPPAPPPPPVYDPVPVALPRASISAARADASARAVQSGDLGAGRLSATGVGGGGLFSGLMPRMSAATTTAGASSARAVAGAKGAAKGL